MTDLTIGQRIAERRKILGLSQEGLGEKTGVSRQAISKWESDGAVPEIDKLISLSRLFGVSVGWLLGVEKEPEQPDNDLSDAQLQTIEEIVRRCQPKSEEIQMKKAVLGSICLIFLAATLALTVLGLRKPNTDTQNLSSQISSLRQENSQIQSRLDEITERLEAMGEGAVLTDYTMELIEVSRELDIHLGTVTVQEDEPVTFARLAITALPQQRQEGDNASLAVFLEGHQIVSAPMSWHQNAYRTEFVLPVADGYEYCFILDRDSIQQMQYLKYTGCDQLAGMTAPSFTMFEPTDILYDGDTLGIKDLTYSFYLSDFGMDQRWDWEKIDLVLVSNGEEVSRIEEGPWQQPEEGVSPGGVMHILHAAFPATGLQEGDDIRLYIDATLSSGVTAKVWLLAMALVSGDVEYSLIAN